MPEVRLIDANALKITIHNTYPPYMRTEHLYRMIESQPTIESKPVRHAYWEPSEVGEYHCTNCGIECDIDKFHKALLNQFCGHCGALMDGGADNG